MFDTENVDNASGVEATGGAARGFTESVADAYDAGYRAMSQLGIQDEMYREVRAQNQRIKDKTGDYPDDDLVDNVRMPRGRSAAAAGVNMTDVARFYEDGGTPEMAEALSKRDATIAELSQRYPELELQSTGDMWAKVRDTARKSEQVAASPGSMVGAFIGEAGAALDPRVNPINVASSVIAPAGRTVATRVVAQGGIQGVAQTINELTGVSENRRLLGLEGGAAGRVATAVAGGALFQGIGEGLVAGGRRLLGGGRAAPDAPPATQVAPDPNAAVAPPVSQQTAAGVLDEGLFRDYEHFQSELQQDAVPTLLAQRMSQEAQNPYGKSRLGQARHEADVEDMLQQMQNYRGEPLMLGTAPVEPVTRAEIITPHWMKTADERIPELARKADPELYAQVDKLEALIAADRQKISGAITARSQLDTVGLDDALAKAEALEDQIAKLRADAAGARDGRRAKKLLKKADVLEAEQERIIRSIDPVSAEHIVGLDTATQSAAQRLNGLEAELRALAPLRKRAEDIAVTQYLDQKPSRETFNIIADVLRADLRINDPDARPVQMSRRPSEKLTAEEGGNNVAPGTVARPGNTSGPDGQPKPGDGVEKMLRDLTHENQNHGAEVEAAFEAAEFIRPKPAKSELDSPAPAPPDSAEVVLGNRRYRLDDVIPIAPVRDEAGNITGVQTMTVRQILKEMGDDSDMLAAMQSCSI